MVCGVQGIARGAHDAVAAGGGLDQGGPVIEPVVRVEDGIEIRRQPGLDVRRKVPGGENPGFAGWSWTLSSLCSPAAGDHSGIPRAWILRLAARLQGLALRHCPLTTLSFRRPRVQIAVSLAAVCAVLLLALWIRGADAQQQQAQQSQDVVLVPHRATYDMKLSVARPNSGIVEVSGAMVLETRRLVRRLGGQAAHQAEVPAQRRRGIRHRFELHQLRDQGRAGPALQRAQHPGRRGRGGAARPGRPRGAGRQGQGRLHPARSAQLRAAGRHPVPDHPSRPDHPARPRRRQIGVLQRVRRRPARRRLPGQCRDRPLAARRPARRRCAAMSACCATSRRGACAWPSSPPATRAAPIRNTSWRSICWATASPARCCSTTVTSP